MQLKPIYVGIIGIFAAMSYVNAEHAKVVAACKQVKLGATEEEVRKLMGTPISAVPFDDGNKKSKILIFPSSLVASTAPQIEIDLQAYRVIEVICDDEYRLAFRKVMTIVKGMGRERTDVDAHL